MTILNGLVYTFGTLYLAFDILLAIMCGITQRGASYALLITIAGVVIWGLCAYYLKRR